MKIITIEVAPKDSGRTLAAILHDRAGFTHSEARGLIDAGAVKGPLRNWHEKRPTGVVGPGEYAHSVAAGERYEVRFASERRYRPRSQPRPGSGYNVVHEDRDLLVVEKEPR